LVISVLDDITTYNINVKEIETIAHYLKPTFYTYKNEENRGMDIAILNLMPSLKVFTPPSHFTG
jgi:hypothetical protein